MVGTIITRMEEETATIVTYNTYAPIENKRLALRKREGVLVSTLKENTKIGSKT